MNEKQLKEIEDGYNAATPGPWWVEYREYTDSDGMIRHQPVVTTQDSDISIVYVDADADDGLIPDAAFIANCRIDVPMLTAEVRRLKSYGDMYRSIAEVRQIERDALAAELERVRAELDAVPVDALLFWLGPFASGELTADAVADAGAKIDAWAQSVRQPVRA